MNIFSKLYPDNGTEIGKGTENVTGTERQRCGNERITILKFLIEIYLF